MSNAECTIQTRHCENCGSTDTEDLDCGDQGYTACCNELVAWNAQECRNHHDDDDGAAIDAEAFDMYRTLVASKHPHPYREVAARYFDPSNHMTAVAAIDRHLAAR